MFCSLVSIISVIWNSLVPHNSLTIFVSNNTQAKLICTTKLAMSESIPHVITQHDDDFNNITMINHVFVESETNLDPATNFDHVNPPQPLIHPFFSNQLKSSKPKINVKGYQRKNQMKTRMLFWNLWKNFKLQNNMIPDCEENH